MVLKEYALEVILAVVLTEVPGVKATSNLPECIWVLTNFRVTFMEPLHKANSVDK
jgi:hypothetical protein